MKRLVLAMLVAASVTACGDEGPGNVGKLFALSCGGVECLGAVRIEGFDNQVIECEWQCRDGANLVLTFSWEVSESCIHAELVGKIPHLDDPACP